ncbi:hypothetical protein DKM27_18505 [Mycobacterium tuberculosis variant bovis]|nr:hypothetical protein DKM27_18505 [Mycobacterium tuberculosis variant bovis]
MTITAEYMSPDVVFGKRGEHVPQTITAATSNRAIDRMAAEAFDAAIKRVYGVEPTDPRFTTPVWVDHDQLVGVLRARRDQMKESSAHVA